MNGLPGALAEAVSSALRQTGDTSAMRSYRLLGGGCINHAGRLETERGVYLLKWNSGAPPGMFTAEARGLELMAATHTVRVPAVYAVAEAQPPAPGWILLEFLEDETESGLRNQAALGEALAALHQAATPGRYGLDFDNFIGSTPQYNEWEDDWATFFAERRLRPQLHLAMRNGRMPAPRRKRLEMLIQRLPGLLSGTDHRPALLHGDLWGGNVIPGPGGVPALIDPAVYYGDREAEIAFTEMFGGFTTRFYQAYHATYPLEPGYAERKEIYNLYHLLNHLNLFGEGYGGGVDAVLERYGE